MAAAHVSQTSTVEADSEASQSSDETATFRKQTSSKYTSHFQTGFYSLIAVVIGSCSVLQGGVNIALAEWIGTPLRSGFISFFVGTLCLSSSLCTPSKDRISAKSLIDNIVTECKSEKRNLLVFFNGSLGVFYLCSAIYIAPVIGFGLFVISIVFGQIITSTLIDHYGLIWSSQRTLSRINLCGPLLAICGDIIFQIPSFSESDGLSNDIMIQIVCVCCSVFAGICFTVQAALNRRLKAISKGSTYQSSLISFCNGTSVLAIVNVIDNAVTAIRGEWETVSDEVPNWYIFIGGMLGAFILSMYILCPSRIGFVTTYLCSIFGSMLTSMLFDYYGAFGVGQGSVSVFKVVGILCVLIGGLMVNLKTKPTESAESVAMSAMKTNDLIKN